MVITVRFWPDFLDLLDVLMRTILKGHESIPYRRHKHKLMKRKVKCLLPNLSWSHLSKISTIFCVEVKSDTLDFTFGNIDWSSNILNSFSPKFFSLLWDNNKSNFWNSISKPYHKKSSVLDFSKVGLFWGVNWFKYLFVKQALNK